MSTKATNPAPETNNTPMYTAGETEARTGIPAATLRQWERRYRLPLPKRAASGYRLYSPADIHCIEFLKTHINQGVPPARAAQLYALHTGSPLPQTSQSPEANSTQKPEPAHQLPELVASLIEATLRGDRPAADRLLTTAHTTMTVEAVMLHVIQPTLIEVGDRWHRNEITVAHEHQASSYLQGKLYGLLEMAGNPRRGPGVVVACAPGEWHEIGALMLTVFLRRAGLRTTYLGANTPIKDLALLAQEFGAEAVLISSSTGASFKELRKQAEELSDEFSGLAKFVGFGGAVFNENPALAGELGGHYLGRDPSAALTVLLSRLAS